MLKRSLVLAVILEGCFLWPGNWGTEDPTPIPPGTLPGGPIPALSYFTAIGTETRVVISGGNPTSEAMFVELFRSDDLDAPPCTGELLQSDTWAVGASPDADLYAIDFNRIIAGKRRLYSAHIVGFAGGPMGAGTWDAGPGPCSTAVGGSTSRLAPPVDGRAIELGDGSVQISWNMPPAPSPDPAYILVYRTSPDFVGDCTTGTSIGTAYQRWDPRVETTAVVDRTAGEAEWTYWLVSVALHIDDGSYGPLESVCSEAIPFHPSGCLQFRDDCNACVARYPCGMCGRNCVLGNEWGPEWTGVCAERWAWTPAECVP